MHFQFQIKKQQVSTVPFIDVCLREERKKQLRTDIFYLLAINSRPNGNVYPYGLSEKIMRMTDNFPFYLFILFRTLIMKNLYKICKKISTSLYGHIYSRRIKFLFYYLTHKF